MYFASDNAESEEVASHARVVIFSHLFPLGMDVGSSRSAVVTLVRCVNRVELAQPRNCFSKVVVSLSRVE